MQPSAMGYQVRLFNMKKPWIRDTTFPDCVPAKGREIAGYAARYFDPFSMENMVKNIREFLLGPAHIDLVAAGKERADKLRWKETARRTIEFYRKVLFQSRQPLLQGEYTSRKSADQLASTL